MGPTVGRPFSTVTSPQVSTEGLRRPSGSGPVALYYPFSPDSRSDDPSGLHLNRSLFGGPRSRNLPHVFQPDREVFSYF